VKHSNCEQEQKSVLQISIMSTHSTELVWVVMQCSDVVGHHSLRMLLPPSPGPCWLNLHPEDGPSRVLWNNSILPHHYMVSQPRRPQLEPSSLQTSKLASRVHVCSKCALCNFTYISGLDVANVDLLLQIQFYLAMLITLQTSHSTETNYFPSILLSIHHIKKVSNKTADHKEIYILHSV
jgi:hypothetical protein